VYFSGQLWGASSKNRKNIRHNKEVSTVSEKFTSKSILFIQQQNCPKSLAKSVIQKFDRNMKFYIGSGPPALTVSNFVAIFDLTSLVK
jgi:hypothetical protein